MSTLNHDPVRGQEMDDELIRHDEYERISKIVREVRAQYQKAADAPFKMEVGNAYAEGTLDACDEILKRIGET